MRQALVLCGLLGCAADVGLSNRTLAPDTTNQCAVICQQLGLRLGSVVVMANNVGCVCNAQPQPPGTAPAPAQASTAAAASTAAGMAVIQIQNDEESSRRRR